MFEYKTKTSFKDGCKFLEQDILLYDYLYSGDVAIECHLQYNRQGFGFVITEQQNNNLVSDNSYIFKIDKDNHYQIIGKQSGLQTVFRSEYIMPGTSFSINESMILLMEYSEGHEVKIYKAEKGSNGINIKHLMFSYSMPHTIEKFKVGFYSNAGNIIDFSAVSSLSPNNWISNIINGRGGRINWIKNGFEIQECEFDCEVESQSNYLEAGKYYFDFKSTNPNIKYYVYLSTKKNTGIKRPMDEILTTKEDERKNILNREDNSFVLKEAHNVNFKFKGKYGTITDIAIKKNSGDPFVETDYDNIKREPSKIIFDLSTIKKIDMIVTISSYDEDGYYLFKNGSFKYDFNHINKDTLEVPVQYIIENRMVNNKYDLSQEDNTLMCFYNVDAVVSKLIVTYTNGDIVDILSQKTVKITVDKNVESPIIATDKSGQPLDLSASYRKIIIPEKKLDIFNRFRPIKLNHNISIGDRNLILFGFNQKGINLDAKTLEDLNIEYELINPREYKVNYEAATIMVDKNTRDKFKNIGVLYSSIDRYIYEFTNWEREIFKPTEGFIYLSGNVNNNYMIVYGIENDIVEDRLYTVPSKGLINSIDEMAVEYELIALDGAYSYNKTTRKLTINSDKYKYIIVDYLKNNSYAINERNSYYEIDISGESKEYKIFYDNPERQYRSLNIQTLKSGSYILLKKEEEEE